MSEAASPTLRRINPLLVGALWTELLLQSVCGGVTLWSMLVRVPGNFERFREAADDPPPSESVAAMRSLPGLARVVPREARVLAVSNLAGVGERQQAVRRQVLGGLACALLVAHAAARLSSQCLAFGLAASVLLTPEVSGR